MNMSQLSLGFGEKVIFALRSLYDGYGYTQYKMSKFEEYDLYARNKDFLISDGVITFTDTNGKLMALKPDVTLSIVKNSRDAVGVQKLYYNENVYRISRGSQSFREIMQVGLECLGDIDDYCLTEVLFLAARSLLCISPASILDVSHLGLLSELMDYFGIPGNEKTALFKFIGEKNAHELADTCRKLGVSDLGVSVLTELIGLSGTIQTVLPRMTQLLTGRVSEDTLTHFTRVLKVLADSDVSGVLHIDFSVVDDFHYYNGIVFKGFIAGLPSSILSGGQYDKLMRKMHRTAGAIGFAVYMDLLERLDRRSREFDVDAVILYDDTADLSVLRAKVDELATAGKVVLAQRQKPEQVKYRKLLRLQDNQVEVLEDHA